jgi:hypothetical protein
MTGQGATGEASENNCLRKGRTWQGTTGEASDKSCLRNGKTGQGMTGEAREKDCLRKGVAGQAGHTEGKPHDTFRMVQSSVSEKGSCERDPAQGVVRVGSCARAPVIPRLKQFLTPVTR